MQTVLILAIAIAIVLVGILVLRLHAFVALLLAAFTVAALTPRVELEKYAHEQVAGGKWTESQASDFLNKQTMGVRVATGFGNTCASVGILIAMASIIGKCLLDSGGADRIVRATLKIFRESGAGIAFVVSGFVLGIPVFFDTVFYLMIPLGKAMRLRTGKNYLFYILTIVAGGTMAHSLVPPTPGPLIVVERFNLNILDMIIGGTVVGLFASTAGYFFAAWINRRIEIPLRTEDDKELKELMTLADKPDRELPPLWLSLAPIILPVLMIAGTTALDTYVKSMGDADPPQWIEQVTPAVKTLGDKNVALTVAAAIAVLMLVWQKRTNRRELALGVQAALASAGIIILITSAGGAFGSAVRQSGIADVISQITDGVQPILILPLAFLVTTMIRTAQGSATVAMITAASVLQDLALNEHLGFHPVYIALAIGCGSKPIAWMADSGFWVMCKMSGMTESEALRTITPLSIIMGVAGLIATMIGAMVLPSFNLIQAVKGLF